MRLTWMVWRCHLNTFALTIVLLNMNSKRVFKILRTRSEYPSARAATIASLSAADFPHSRVAVKVTVGERIFSAIASTNDNIA